MRRPLSSSLRACSSRSIDASNQAQRLRPDFLAAYIAMSAERISVSMPAQSMSDRAMPIDAEMWQRMPLGVERLRHAG